MVANPDTLPVVIVGAGAAGLMAAISAAAGPRPVLLLEGTARPGQKILISGGGRCNVLPSQASAGDYASSGSVHTLRKIFSAWPPAEVRRFFEQDLGLALRLEPETGKLFPAANRARAVLDTLLIAVNQRGGRLRTNARVQALSRGTAHWHVHLTTGETIPAARVILATGGLSVPTTGSDGAGLHMAATLCHTLAPTYPALVPLTGDQPAHRDLAGVALPVTLVARSAEGKVLRRSQGGFLFTHRGYSGPAVLDISHVAVLSTIKGGPRPRISVQWSSLDAEGWDRTLRTGRGSLLSLLRTHLPERLAALLLAEGGLTGLDLSQLSRPHRQTLVAALTDYPLPWTGHEGYRTAEVTGGGIPLSEINPATLESRVAPGVHLCGEMLDAFGPIGGYNFLWAWTTGWLAGRACNPTLS